jgi:hypothetical protein
MLSEAIDNLYKILPYFAAGLQPHKPLVQVYDRDFSFSNWLLLASEDEAGRKLRAKDFWTSYHKIDEVLRIALLECLFGYLEPVSAKVKTRVDTPVLTRCDTGTPGATLTRTSSVFEKPTTYVESECLLEAAVPGVLAAYLQPSSAPPLFANKKIARAHQLVTAFFSKPEHILWQHFFADLEPELITDACAFRQSFHVNVMPSSLDEDYTQGSSSETPRIGASDDDACAGEKRKAPEPEDSPAMLRTNSNPFFTGDFHKMAQNYLTFILTARFSDRAYITQAKISARRMPAFSFRDPATRKLPTIDIDFIIADPGYSNYLFIRCNNSPPGDPDTFKSLQQDIIDTLDGLFFSLGCLSSEGEEVMQIDSDPQANTISVFIDTLAQLQQLRILRDNARDRVLAKPEPGASSAARPALSGGM